MRIVEWSAAVVAVVGSLAALVGFVVKTGRGLASLVRALDDIARLQPRVVELAERIATLATEYRGYFASVEARLSRLEDLAVEHRGGVPLPLPLPREDVPR